MLNAKRFRAFAALLCAVVLAAGCEDLSFSGGNSTHQVAIVSGGLVVATASPAGVVTGTLAIAPGAQRTITISVLDRGGDPITLGANDQIRVIVLNTTVATFTATAAGANSVTGTLRGVTTGNTTSLTVQLLRAGTAEYNSPNIPITVS